MAEGEDQFVVTDTAPTGHTLLLLDAAEAYHREVLRKASGSSPAVQCLLPRLRDPAFTKVLLITLPESTPVHEAMRLERDLARAGIKPFAWVINQSLRPRDALGPIPVRNLCLATRAGAIPWSALGTHHGMPVLLCPLGWIRKSPSSDLRVLVKPEEQL